MSEPVEHAAGTDITARLTTWCHAPQAASAQDIMDEAAREIERLRCVTKPLPKEIWAEHSLHPTDEERRVLRDLRDSYAAEDDQECNRIASVLHGLLERLNCRENFGSSPHLSERDRDLLRFAANTIGDADCSELFRRLLRVLG